MIGLLSAASPEAAAAPVLRLDTLKTHSRLVLSWAGGGEIERQDAPGGFRVLLKGATLADLGAPIGEEAAWKERYARLADPRVAGIELHDDEKGVWISGTWRFPEGKLALARPRMEAFDFRDPERGRWVMDFWLADRTTLAEARAEAARTARSRAVREAAERSRRNVARRLASERAQTRADRLAGFCDQPLRDDQDVVLTFSPVRAPLPFASWLPGTTPDAGYVPFRPGDGDPGVDAQGPPRGRLDPPEAYLRLAQDLYEKGDVALAVRTLDFLERDHRGHKFRAEALFLRANAHYRLGQANLGRPILDQLMREFRGSAPALHAGLYLAPRQLQEEGNPLGALDTFLWLIAHYPEHQKRWLFHLGAAEAAYRLRQTERAVVQYGEASTRATDPAIAAEAASRAADAYLERGQLEQALAAYFRAAQRFPDETAAMDGFRANRAETLYRLTLWGRAQAEFESYLKDFGGKSDAWRATYRLAEIAARQGSRAAPAAVSRYLETANRFPFAPGATLARLRLAECPPHGAFDAEGALRFFAEDAARFESTPGVRDEIRLENYDASRRLSLVRALATFGKVSAAAIEAAASLSDPRHRHRPALESLRAIGAAAFRRTLLDEPDGYAALAFLTKFASQFPARELGYEPDYLRELSLVAGDLGLGARALELVTEYLAIWPLPTRPAGEIIPIADELREAETRWVHARALWQAQGPAAEARITALLAQIPDESRRAYGRELLRARMAEAAGRSSPALAYALRAEALAQRLTLPAGERARRQAWIAGLQEAVGLRGDAAGTIAQLLRAPDLAAGRDVGGSRQGNGGEARALGLAPVPSGARLALRRGELLEAAGRWGDAAAAFAEAGTQGADAAMTDYRAARMWLKAGARERGREVLEKLAGDAGGAPGGRNPAAAAGETGFWKRLAQEALVTNEFENAAKEGGKP